jgi:hypothetical protein
VYPHTSSKLRAITRARGTITREMNCEYLLNRTTNISTWEESQVLKNAATTTGVMTILWEEFDLS